MKHGSQPPKSKSGLAIQLSKLAVFENPKLMSEQYATDSESAAEALWFAYMNGDIQDHMVADLGCGTGLLGIGALQLGADKVYFVDNDKEAIDVCNRNLATATDESAASKAVVIAADILDFHEKVDCVVQNPPFGTKAKHADRQFLLQAFKVGQAVYSIHKIETADFVKKIAADNGFTVTNILPLQLQLKNTYEFHRSKMRRVDVGMFRIVKRTLVSQHSKPYK